MERFPSEYGKGRSIDRSSQEERSWGPVTGRKPKWWRRFWIESAIVLVTISVLDVSLYLFNVIDLNGLAQAIMWMFAVICSTYALRHILLDVLSDKALLRTSKIGYTMIGVSLGIPVGLILFSPRILSTLELWVRFLLTFGVAPPIGGLVAYSIGKRRGFRTQVTEWRETHRSIDETDEE